MKKIIAITGMLFCLSILGCFWGDDYELEQINAGTPGVTFCEYVVTQIDKADDRLLIKVGDTICISCNTRGTCPNPNAGETFKVKTFDTVMNLSLVNSACGACTHMFAFKVV